MGRPSKMNRMGYSQFLLSSQTNYTLTYFAEHVAEISHDAINRYLAKDKLTPGLLWEHISPDIIPSRHGYLIFDDTVLDKSSSQSIEIARWQYSGNVGKVIRGIGVVTCVYFNPEINRYWAIDYRIYAPDQDGKSKIDHVEEMLTATVHQKQLLLKTVLMDTWYATNRLMLVINSLQKIFYCSIKSNRLVSRVDQKYTYMPVTQLNWSSTEEQNGIRVHLNKINQHFHVQLFRIAASTRRTDYVVTNDLSQQDLDAVQKAYGLRWVIETLHRELKTVTGIEQCQCRKQRIQRNHIACAFLVWARLKSIGQKTKQTVYQLKQGLLRNYMIQQLKSPAISASFA